jgi:glycosyltransferase involved in cell wall biosynthesis
MTTLINGAFASKPDNVLMADEPPNPEISVVVATRNRAPRLERLLDGLRAQSIGADRFEVIVVDDGSTDETANALARIKAGWPAMRVITRAQPAGPATAREEGWRAATGGVIAFTDDDCVPVPHWLERGLAAIEANAGAFVQGRTAPNPAEVDSLGPFSRTIEVAELHPAFNTCNIFYPRAVLEQVDGFDARAFGRSPGGEDCDLAWRAIAAGARPVFEPEAVVHHAVDRVGPIGMLRVAARWTTPMLAYARHPGLRRDFVGGIFWKRTHYWLARAILGALLPTRLAPLRNWLMYPYLRDIWARGRVLGGGPLLAPWYVLCDVVETVAVARAAVRYRRLML